MSFSMYTVLGEKIAQCCGCSACVAECPVNCISMRENSEGFLYPEIDNNCIHCGRCKAICPVLNPISKEIQESEESVIAWAAIAKDESIQESSSSGGVFSLLANKTMPLVSLSSL